MTIFSSSESIGSCMGTKAVCLRGKVERDVVAHGKFLTRVDRWLSWLCAGVAQEVKGATAHFG